MASSGSSDQEHPDVICRRRLAHDVRLAGKLLLADRGYDADWIRELAMKKGAWANIAPKSNRSDPICFSP
jgi:transposase